MAIEQCFLINHLGQRTRRILKTLGIIKYPNKRALMAGKYLSGHGLEIGALHSPLLVPDNVRVEYLDIASRQESIRKLPEEHREFVEVDYIADGFTMEGVPRSQFDFLIANHVLEHSPNPIGTLVCWSEVLKVPGLIFCTLPLADRCFDKGRRITSYEHMAEDYQTVAAGKAEVMKERNREHYLEWLTISINNMKNGKQPPLSGNSLHNKVAEMIEQSAEIHFHTFSAESIVDFFRRIMCDFMPWLQVVEVATGRNEIIVILKKNG